MIGKQTPNTMAVVSLPDVLLTSAGKSVEDVISGVGDVGVLLFIVGFFDGVDCKTDIIVDKRMVEEEVDENDDSGVFVAFSDDVNSDLSVVVWMSASVVTTVGVCLIESGTDDEIDVKDHVGEVVDDSLDETNVEDNVGEVVDDTVDETDVVDNAGEFVDDSVDETDVEDNAGEFVDDFVDETDAEDNAGAFVDDAVDETDAGAGEATVVVGCCIDDIEKVDVEDNAGVVIDDVVDETDDGVDVMNDEVVSCDDRLDDVVVDILFKDVEDVCRFDETSDVVGFDEIPT